MQAMHFHANFLVYSRIQYVYTTTNYFMIRNLAFESPWSPYLFVRSCTGIYTCTEKQLGHVCESSACDSTHTKYMITCHILKTWYLQVLAARNVSRIVKLIHVRICIHTHKHMYSDIHTHIYIYIYIYTHTHTYAYIHTDHACQISHTHTHRHTCMHAYMDAYRVLHDQ
jgi:hypothetical protein